MLDVAPSPFSLRNDKSHFAIVAFLAALTLITEHCDISSDIYRRNPTDMQPTKSDSDAHENHRKPQYTMASYITCEFTRLICLNAVVYVFSLISTAWLLTKFMLSLPDDTTKYESNDMLLLFLGCAAALIQVATPIFNFGRLLVVKEEAAGIEKYDRLQGGQMYGLSRR